MHVPLACFYGILENNIISIKYKLRYFKDKYEIKRGGASLRRILNMFGFCFSFKGLLR